MAVLKKIKAATLMETLVATVLIVIVFMTASLLVNNLFIQSISMNTHDIENFLFELEYELKNETIDLPYSETYKGWEITVNKETKTPLVNLEALHLQSKKLVQHQIWLYD